MRIINQLGNASFNFDSLVVTVNDCMVCTDLNGKTIILGRYKDSERALEVFKEIHTSSDVHSIYYLPKS